MPNFGTCLVILDLDGSRHTVTRSGLLFAYGDKSSGAPLTLLHDAARVTDFSSGKRAAAIRQRLEACGYIVETRFDAPHGRRYLGCAFHKIAPGYDSAACTRERRIVLAAADGISSLRQYALDSGIPADELPVIVEPKP